MTEPGGATKSITALGGATKSILAHGSQNRRNQIMKRACVLQHNGLEEHRKCGRKALKKNKPISMRISMKCTFYCISSCLIFFSPKKAALFLNIWLFRFDQGVRLKRGEFDFTSQPLFHLYCVSKK